jgi:hypothetical protein
MDVNILEGEIEIKNYPYNNFFRKKKAVTSKEITFIKVDTYEIFICIDKNEILIIPKRYEQIINQYIRMFNIPTSEEKDIWKLICYPFVDSHRTSEELIKNMEELNSLSFSNEEVVVIRNRIKKLMYWWVMFTMEHVELGMYDVLQAKRKISFYWPFQKSFYFYVMDIGLRGFKCK